MQKRKIGLLLFYLELYDKTSPENKTRAKAFASSISKVLSDKGADVVMSRVCRLKNEFKREISRFKDEGVDAIVTLHLAYSPSLESCEALASANIPVVIFDTTPDSKFGPSQNPARIMLNHGIHGVQDLCSMLVRHSLPFSITAGHWKDAGTVDSLMRKIRSAKIASSFKKSRTGLIGSPFKGMGDFQVPRKDLEKLGITVLKAQKTRLQALLKDIGEKELEEEAARDEKLFDVKKLNGGIYKATLRSSLAVRKWAVENKLTAFTMNFLDIDKKFLPAVPFLEASKLMSKGLGYAGEGDVLTASLAGAVLSVYKETTFTEMFCPDWEGGSIFMSHMGEVNPLTLQGKAKLTERNFPYTDAENPVIASGRLKSGRAHLLNLAPLGGGKYRLIICPGSLPRVKEKDRMSGAVRGWFKPELPLNIFLEEYSRHGGTHHSVLVYDSDAQILDDFGKFMTWETVTLC